MSHNSLSPSSSLPPISTDFLNRVLELAVEIQQIPAPTFAEQQRAEFVKQKFIESGLQDVAMDSLFNVFARRPGGAGQSIMVSAHLDTVFDAGTDLAITREAGRIAGPGIGDNSLAVASLVSLAWLLNDFNIALPGDLWLVANSGEEGLGDLKGMRAAVDRLEHEIAGYIVLEGSGFGNIIDRGVGSRRYKITAKAPGGHSWADFGQTSAIHTLVQLASKLTTLQVPDAPKTTFNIGVIEGGTSVNTIAETANLQLDLRSESARALRMLIQQVDDLVSNFEPDDASISIEMIGDRPAGRLDGDHPLFLLAWRSLSTVGADSIVSRAGSTDANVPLSRGYPAVCIGLTRGANLHRLSEYIEVEPFSHGFEQLVRLTVETSQLYAGEGILP